MSEKCARRTKISTNILENFISFKGASSELKKKIQKLIKIPNDEFGELENVSKN